MRRRQNSTPESAKRGAKVRAQLAAIRKAEGQGADPDELKRMRAELKHLARTRVARTDTANQEPPPELGRPWRTT